MATYGKGNLAVPTDEIGFLRSDVEGYATLESVMHAGAAYLVHPDSSNQLQAVGTPTRLYVPPATAIPDAIDDNPTRVGNVWVAGDRMAVAAQPIGSVDEQADVEAYLAAAFSSSAVLQTTINTIVGGGGGGVPDSIDDNPPRPGGAWLIGDQMAVAQPGGVDEKTDVESFIGDVINNSAVVQSILNTVVTGAADSIDDNPARPGGSWMIGDSIAVAQPGSPDEKADAESFIGDVITNSTVVQTALTSVGIDSIDDNPVRPGNTWATGDRLAVAAAAAGSVDEQVDAEGFMSDLINNSTNINTSITNIAYNASGSVQLIFQAKTTTAVADIVMPFDMATYDEFMLLVTVPDHRVFPGFLNFSYDGGATWIVNNYYYIEVTPTGPNPASAAGFPLSRSDPANVSQQILYEFVHVHYDDYAIRLDCTEALFSGGNINPNVVRGYPTLGHHLHNLYGTPTHMSLNKYSSGATLAIGTEAKLYGVVK